MEKLGQSFLGNMLSKHSPPQFCHVEELFKIVLTICLFSQWLPFVLRMKCKLLAMACKACLMWPLDASSPDPILSPTLTSLQPSNPQVPLWQAPSGLGGLIPFCSLCLECLSLRPLDGSAVLNFCVSSHDTIPERSSLTSL